MRRTTRLGLAMMVATITVFAARPLASPQDDIRLQGSADRAAQRAVYIVRLTDEPAGSYEGTIAGLPRTKPARGQKVNPGSAEVSAYGSYLAGRHDLALGAVGGGRKLYDYQIAFNGFAAELTDDQVNALRSRGDVLTVEKDQRVYADTATTPAFLGLDGPGGLWDQLGGSDRAGDGVVIGVIDSGIWPESQSFSDRIGGKNGRKLDYHHLPGWHGKCQKGEDFKVSDCNQKLIGARFYNAGQGGNAGVDADMPWEFNSPRDYNGHGTHTASTAGGNAHVPTTGPAKIFGEINGMAPHAGSPSTRRSGPLKMDPPPAAPARTSSRRSIRRSRTASTSSTIPSAAPPRICSMRSRSRSCSPRTLACSSRRRLVTMGRHLRRSRTRVHG